MWMHCLLVIFSGSTLIPTGYVYGGAQATTVNLRSLNASSAVPVQKLGKPFVKEEVWKGEKPRLVGVTSKDTDPPKRSQDTLQDTHMGGCKECFRKIQNLSDLCRFEVVLAVRPIEKTGHRFIVNISAVYRDGPELSLEQNTSITLHLAKTNEQSLSINKDLVRCSCPYLRPNTSYIVFGRPSRRHQGVVIVVRAQSFSTNQTVSKRTDTLLRNSAQVCSHFEATKPTRATDLGSTQGTSQVSHGFRQEISPVPHGHMKTMQLDSRPPGTTATVTATDPD
jgi:hypothetical protein